MIKLTAYKHETGKIFYSLEEYNDYDKGFKIRQKQAKDRKERASKIAQEKKRIFSEIYTLEKEEKERIKKRKQYVVDKVRPITNSIDDMKLQIQKLRKAINITNGSLRSHRAEYEKEFNKVEPTKAKKVGALRRRYSGLVGTRKNIYEWKTLRK